MGLFGPSKKQKMMQKDVEYVLAYISSLNMDNKGNPQHLIDKAISFYDHIIEQGYSTIASRQFISLMEPMIDKHNKIGSNPDDRMLVIIALCFQCVKDREPNERYYTVECQMLFNSVITQLQARVGRA